MSEKKGGATADKENRQLRIRRLIETGAVVDKALGRRLESESQRELLLEILTEPRKDRGGGSFTYAERIIEELDARCPTEKEAENSGRNEAWQQIPIYLAANEKGGI